MTDKALSRVPTSPTPCSLCGTEALPRDHLTTCRRTAAPTPTHLQLTMPPSLNSQGLQHFWGKVSPPGPSVGSLVPSGAWSHRAAPWTLPALQPTPAQNLPTRPRPHLVET